MRPLTVIALCAILTATITTYLPATACKDNPSSAAHDDADGRCTTAVVTVSICDAPDTEDRSAVDTVKSALRAGKAVGRAVATTAKVVATSMARAAKHAAVALAESAYSLV